VAARLDAMVKTWGLDEPQMLHALIGEIEQALTILAATIDSLD